MNRIYKTIPNLFIWLFGPVKNLAIFPSGRFKLVLDKIKRLAPLDKADMQFIKGLDNSQLYRIVYEMNHVFSAYCFGTRLDPIKE
jgi:hypothetical protein